MQDLITQHLDLWTTANRTKATAGRGNGGKSEAYGVRKLKELILDLAIQGKLVAQNSRDIPASEILREALDTRLQLLKDKQISKSKAPLSAAEAPSLQIPSSWAWTTLYELGEISPRNEADDSVVASFIPMTMISEHYGDHVEHETRPWKEIKTGFTHFREGDVVLAKITPCFQNGKSAVMRNLTGGFGAGTTELHVFRPLTEKVVPEYVLIYLKSRKFIADGIPKMTGTAGQKRITRDYFAGNPFPLPPFEEQQRIVAKVDELMTLCDQLEQQQSTSLEAHKTLVATLLDTLTRAESAADFQQAWQRIATHFDTLFTTEHSIDQLKQTILQLAVMGKLVTQGPKDEPAAMQLERIKEEKARQFADGRIRKEKPLDARNGNDWPNTLPGTWEWVNLEDLVDITSGVTLGRKLAGKHLVKVPYLRVANVQRGHLTLDDVKEIDIPVEELEKFTIREGDLLITEGGDWDKVGRTATWRKELPLVAHQNHVFKARCFLETQNVSWLELYLNSNVARQYFAGSSKQTTNLASINKTQLRRCPIALPPNDEQSRIIERVSKLHQICDDLSKSIRTCAQVQMQLADAIVEQAFA